MKNELKFTGIVVEIRPLQQFPSNTDPSKIYRKQEIIVEEDDEQYPNSILLEVFDKLEKLDGIAVGDNIEVVYNTRARAWEKNGKSGVMCTNSIWKITNLSGNAPAAQRYAPASPNPVTGVAPTNPVDEKDLPF